MKKLNREKIKSHARVKEKAITPQPKTNDEIRMKKNKKRNIHKPIKPNESEGEVSYNRLCITSKT